MRGEVNESNKSNKSNKSKCSGQVKHSKHSEHSGGSNNRNESKGSKWVRGRTVQGVIWKKRTRRITHNTQHNTTGHNRTQHNRTNDTTSLNVLKASGPLLPTLPMPPAVGKSWPLAKPARLRNLKECKGVSRSLKECKGVGCSGNYMS